jgi:histidyl-tRNA synthetase
MSRTKKIQPKKPEVAKDVIKKTRKLKSKQFQTVRGMRDILPDVQPYWQKVRKAVEKISNDYSYQRIDLPLVEFRELYERGTGKSTDIVEKEMFKFKTQGTDDVALRPEGTPGVVRAYLQNGMQSWSKPVKLSYMGPMYRYDRPQEGRYREFYQFGFEAIGEKDAILDAQVIQMALRVFKLIGFKKLSLQINSIGCSECRPSYNSLLVSYLNNRKKALCMDCKNRLKKNPLRVLDCKEEKCTQVVSQAPQAIDHLCKECKDHFTFLLECLDELDVPYEINSKLVRGLDYYTKTVFEIWSTNDEKGARMALGGGGRYDELVESLGGKKTPGVGFAAGVDRVTEKMKEIGVKAFYPAPPRVYLAQLGDMGKKKSLKVFEELEKAGIGVAESFGRGNLRSQLNQANQLDMDLVLIIGQREALDETVIIKDMKCGSQEVVAFNKVVNQVKKRLKNS